MHEVLISVHEDINLKISAETAERLRQAAQTILEREGIEVKFKVVARHDHGYNAITI